MTYKLILAFLLIAITTKAQKDTAKTAASIKKATVYYGYGAELSHLAKLSVTKNTRFIVIDKLSTQMDINSLQISCPENVSLLSQQFMVYYPTIKPKPVIANIVTKRIQDSIKVVSKLMGAIQSQIDIEQTTMQRTEKLIESTIATSGNKTALTAEVLKLIEFNNAKIERSKKLMYEYNGKLGDYQETLDALQQRLEVLQNEVENTENQNEADKQEQQKGYGRIIMQVLCREASQMDINLSYFTNNAGWQPMYDLRVDSKTNNIKLVYKASVTQNTGVDWKNTAITLSTGSPNFTTEAPIFNPWYLQLYAPQVYKALQGRSAGMAMNSVQSMDMKLNEIDDVNVTGYNKAKKELAKPAPAPTTVEDYTTLKEGLLNTSFEIDLPYDIESNGLPHSISIKEQVVKSTLKNYAVPKLDADAYLLAEVTSWENLDLLPGNANIIMDETYIGRSYINPNTTLDTLNLSLGKDKRVGVKRTLVKDMSKTKSKDNFTIQTFTYELVVRNNKTKDLQMLLKDQYPMSTITDIEVKLLDDGGADVNNEEVGVLTWKINLKPGEVKKYRFSYTIKYPKDKKIANIK
jgi:uncharacterized protein (TIGR02231 family)